MMLYRDEFYHTESPAAGIAEISITKNRKGPLGSVYRGFWNRHFHYIDQVEEGFIESCMSMLDVKLEMD